MRDLRYKNMEFMEYARYMSMLGQDNGTMRSRLMRNLQTAMSEELTGRQRRMMELYYIDRVKMSEIAADFGVNISTVSRTIGLGRKRLKRCLRYGAKELLNQSDN